MDRMPKVMVVMGSDSDFPVVESCIKTLKEFAVMTEVYVCSAHRTPDRASELSKNAEKDGFDVIIAAAGKAAHLPGVLAAYTPLPVIGLPIESSTLDGLDSLLSIVQMPSGIPVATVALDGSVNAALLAVQIISTRDAVLRKKMIEYKANLSKKIEIKNKELRDKIQEGAKL